MAKHVLNKDLKTTWNVVNDDGLWIVPVDHRIVVKGVNGLYESAALSSNEIRIFGDIKASGTGMSGVQLEGSGTLVTVGKESVITADKSISLLGTGEALINNGTLTGGSVGVWSENNSVVVNTGSITGNTGVMMQGHNDPMTDEYQTLNNGEKGRIEGLEYGVQINGLDSGGISNAGLISGSVYAIMDAGGKSLIENEGTIIGKVQLANGDNWFNNGDGKMEGTVYGGLNDDRYVVGLDNYGIVDNSGYNSVFVQDRSSYKAASGIDAVFASISEATGTKLIGNDMANFLQGAAGADTLVGGRGSDELFGQQGLDILTGGAGNDVFRFSALDSQRDKITDFTIDKDDMHIYSDITNFDAMMALGKDQGDDVVFTLSKGVGFTLVGVHKAELDANDFLFN